MGLQAFIDDSRDEDGTFILGGCIADNLSWENFSREWTELLPLGVINGNGLRYFKMSHMARDRRDVQPFYRVIEKNTLGFISCQINQEDLKRVIKRIKIPNQEIDWENFSSPYWVCFNCLIDLFHKRRPVMQEILGDKKIDFYFDEQEDQKKLILDVWENFVKNRPDDVKKYYGSKPKFEKEEEFVPLQAADFWAWWVRKWYSDKTPEKIIERDFGDFRKMNSKKIFTIDISHTEDQLYLILEKALRARLGESTPIYDVSNSALQSIK